MQRHPVAANAIGFAKRFGFLKLPALGNFTDCLARLRGGFAQFKLCAHFLQASGQRVNSFLLAGNGRSLFPAPSCAL